LQTRNAELIYVNSSVDYTIVVGNFLQASRSINASRVPPTMFRRSARIGLRAHNVRFGSKADICAATPHVRFTPNSDRESRPAQTVMSALALKADMCGATSDVG